MSNMSYAELLEPISEDEAKLARETATDGACRAGYTKGLVEAFLASGHDAVRLNADGLAQMLGKTEDKPLDIGALRTNINKLHKERNFPVGATRIGDTLDIYRVATEGPIKPPGKRGRKPNAEKAVAAES